MKDISLPNISNEENRKMYKDAKVGDKFLVFDRYPYSRDYRYYELEVTKITPTGRLRMNNGDLLKDMPFNFRKPTKDVLLFMESLTLQDEIATKIFYINGDKSKFEDMLTYEDVLQLRDILSKY